MTPTDSETYSPTFDQARQELREGIENSREIVRQSGLLIALSECDGSATNDNEDYGIAN